MTKVPLSVIIPVKNEEANLPRCLESISWADEIFVIDSQSTDHTVQIAEEAGASVVQFHYQSPFPKKKNWALANLPFRHSWVFILDADEVLPPAAEKEIRAIVTQQTPPYAGYWINRRFHFLGQPLRHAYFPNWNLRLFLHKRGRFEKLTDEETHSGDNEVHEHVLVEGETSRLQCVMEHYAFPDMETFLEKHQRYAAWEAHVRTQHTNMRVQDGEVAKRRQLKQLALRLPFRPWLRFLYVYLWQRGFLDGQAGFHFARLHKIYEEMILIKTYELRLSAREK